MSETAETWIIVGAIAAAILSPIAIVIVARLQGGRDDRFRWSGERRTVYLQVLGAAADYRATAVLLAQERMGDEIADNQFEPRRRGPRPGRQGRDTLRDAIDNARLIASNEIVERLIAIWRAAEQLVEAELKLAWAVEGLDYAEDPEEIWEAVPDEVAQVQRAAKEGFRSELEVFREAARTELQGAKVVQRRRGLMRRTSRSANTRPGND